MVFALMDLKVRLRKAEDLVNKLYRASTDPLGRVSLTRRPTLEVAPIRDDQIDGHDHARTRL
jgi:hypothetical protein